MKLPLPSVLPAGFCSKLDWQMQGARVQPWPQLADAVIFAVDRAAYPAP